MSKDKSFVESSASEGGSIVRGIAEENTSIATGIVEEIASFFSFSSSKSEDQKEYECTCKEKK